MNWQPPQFQMYRRVVVYPSLLILATLTAMGTLLPERLLLAQTGENRRGFEIDYSPVQRQGNDRRVALVIGNGNYNKVRPLRNPQNDANDMATVFEGLDFEVIRVVDGTREEMNSALEDFFQAVRGGSTAAFYFAGHGIQSHGENYLIPTDARLISEGRLQYEAIALGEVLNYMEDAGTVNNIIILDACRDNPFTSNWARSRSGVTTRGLISIQRPGVLIAYATLAGEVADDGRAGDNGIYTSALLNHLRRLRRLKGQSILEMLNLVAAEVEQNTNGAQQPFFTLAGSLQFTLNPLPEPHLSSVPRREQSRSISLLDERLDITCMMSPTGIPTTYARKNENGEPVYIPLIRWTNATPSLSAETLLVLSPLQACIEGSQRWQTVSTTANGSLYLVTSIVQSNTGIYHPAICANTDPDTVDCQNVLWLLQRYEDSTTVLSQLIMGSMQGNPIIR